MTPLWVIETANEFWQWARIDDSFPRGLCRPIARALPLTLVYLSRLTLQQVRDWLKNVGIACPCSEPDRWLRACLVASSGNGFVFVDATDPADEQRFSLAHELAHFLKHYWQPRCLASRRGGELVCEVFDGLRPATPEERLDSLLQRVTVGPARRDGYGPSGHGPTSANRQRPAPMTAEQSQGGKNIAWGSLKGRSAR